MNIVLIGYRGTGKSTVGRLLADRLGRSLVSTDAEIVRQAGQSIPDLVKQYGWEHFRDLEAEVCRELASQDSLIIDTGGGIILRQENIDRLRANGRLFWLNADIPTIIKRIGRDTQRPSLTGGKSFIDEIEEVLAERRPRYQAAADHQIDTTGRSPDQVIDEVLAKL